MTTDEAKARDAARGAMWEEKYRGTLEDHRSPDLLDVAGRRWLSVPEPSPVSAAWDLVNRVGWGTYGWKYDLSLVGAAIKLGAGIIDTAEGYGFGRVETKLGEVLRKGTGGTWIASKVARNHLSAAATVEAGKRSRDRLKIPAIDLYQIHWPVMDLLPRTLDGLADLLQAGVIRRVGVSNFCAGQLATAMRFAEERGFRIESNQVRVNADDAGNLEYLVPYCVRLGVRVLAYSPLGQGKLSLERSEGLRWVLAQPGVSATMPSTNNHDHLRENLRLGHEKTPEGIWGRVKGTTGGGEEVTSPSSRLRAPSGRRR